ncbi:Blue-light-activated protein [Rubripirellula obstinata]|uniref:histidine kinase n=1 Tax=Rubripirellula obstinata TaxID=406547 RepID=A0A5B1CHZ9_9BACT|nr:PAS domain-containing sensor histidine kinase [Rubripirellula obstinata]KAA1260827.1 Blue-light-activated protein [Rubripirellula obstinata]
MVSFAQRTRDLANKNAIISIVVLLLGLHSVTLGFCNSPDKPKEIFRSVRELSKWSRKGKSMEAVFDLQAHIVLTGPKWCRLIVQDKKTPVVLTIPKTMATRICKIPVGTRLRLRGQSSRDEKGKTTNVLQFFADDLNADVIEPEAAKLAPGTKGTPLNRFAVAEGKIQEILNLFHRTYLIASEKDYQFGVKFYLDNHRLSSQQVGQRWRFEGCLRRNRSTAPNAPLHELVLMNDLQMSPIPESKEKETQDLDAVEMPKAFEGLVVFSDSSRNLGIIKGDERIWIKTSLGSNLSYGSKVRGVGSPVWNHGLDVACYKSLYMETFAGNRLTIPEPTQVDGVDDLFAMSRLPTRVRLKATVDYCIFNEATMDLHLVANQHEAIVRIPTSADSPTPSFGILAEGTEIEFVGLPILDLITTRERKLAGDYTMRIHVGSAEDVVIIDRPVNVSSNRLLAGGGLLFVGLASVGFWIVRLRRRVKVSDRNLTEFDHHIQTAFGAMQCGFLIVDEQSRIIRSNHRLSSFFGVEPSLNSCLREYLTSVDQSIEPASGMSDLIDAGGHTPGRALSAEFFLEDCQRTIRIFHCPIELDWTNGSSKLWLFEDVSEKRRLESELHQSQKMDAVGRLSGGIAHDFNNLLTVIDSSLAMIRGDAFDNDTDRNHLGLQAAELAVKRASELTQQLLGFARRQRLEKKRVNAVSLAENVELLASRIIGSTQDFLVQRECDRIMLNVDPNRIEQAIFNLCINAIDATRQTDGRVCLTIASEMHAVYGWSARFTVADNGPGISRDDQQFIFDPFFTTKPLGQGTGLGLSVALGIVQQHGGRIECQSNSEDGTQFSVVLPAIAEDVLVDGDTSQQQIELDPTSSSLESSSQQTPSLSVLVVEDEPSVQTASCSMLEKLGHQADPVASAVLAISRLASNSYDLVLLDLMLPEMSGVEAFHEIRSCWPDLPILFCSGRIDAEDVIRDGCGADAAVLLAKPFTVDQLKSMLDSVMLSSADSKS